MSTSSISFKPKQVVKRLLSSLSDRSIDIITKRYGLGKNPEPMTLDAIGKTYGITRERVRQIENHVLGQIRKSKQYSDEKPIFEEMEKLIHKLGCIVTEKELLEEISKDAGIQSQINFILVLGNSFTKFKEDEDFRHRWLVDSDIAEKVHVSLKKLYESLKYDDLLSEENIIKAFLGYIEGVADQYKSEEMAKRWLSISKKLGKNALGEWGRSESPNITTKGMRDYAFLVIRRHGSPIHFKEVAEAITQTFNKKAHIATTHNELIKDPRFVLVGRGLYALKEWGYTSGVVKDVIKGLIEKNGPITKEEIIQKVLKERYVKENTIVINLQNKKYFKKGKDNKYEIVK